MIARRWKLLVLFFVFIVHCGEIHAQDVVIRVMTFNIEDVRHSDAEASGNARLERIAEVIQRVRPNIVLLNEIEEHHGSGQSTAQAFTENYLMVPQAEGLDSIDFESLTPRSNTGISTGLDLDRSGAVASVVPFKSIPQTAEQRAYGGDCFGFGGFPGQYGMSLLVDPRLTIDLEGIRTFQKFLWKDLPRAIAPTDPDGSAYYSDEAWEIFRLSSKTFADVPIEFSNGAVIHVLISHPTPPAFDGVEMRNKHRNRDEIRLIRAYIDGDDAIYDDDGVDGGMEDGAPFVILGDLNADPVDGSSIGDPIVDFLFGCDQVGEDVAPRSGIHVHRLDPTDTSSFRLRVDYVLPSSDLRVLDSGVWRYGVHDPGGFASDHFPVWADLILPAP